MILSSRLYLLLHISRWLTKSRRITLSWCTAGLTTVGPRLLAQLLTRSKQSQKPRNLEWFRQKNEKEKTNLSGKKNKNKKSNQGRGGKSRRERSAKTTICVAFGSRCRRTKRSLNSFSFLCSLFARRNTGYAMKQWMSDQVHWNYEDLISQAVSYHMWILSVSNII